ncbi:uncharacterized protein PG986_014223 [Apiospora aurea]|uniref:Ankyrin n=1 Tax=Apiospora aurea TaxID=335848 RepID=A0ABR1PSD5_9PEZI
MEIESMTRRLSCAEISRRLADYQTESDVIFEQHRYEAEAQESHPFEDYLGEFEGSTTWRMPDVNSGLFPDEFHDQLPELNQDGNIKEVQVDWEEAEEPFPRWKSLTILQWACSVGNVATVDMMIDVAERLWVSYCVCPHREAAEYLTQFHDESAIEEIRVDYIEDWKLVDPNFDLIVHPLHLACYMGMQQVVKALIDLGADVNAQCVPFNAPENACRMVEEDNYVDVWLWSGHRCCALSLSMQNDANWDCTQLILKKYPDLSAGFLKKCVHDTFAYANSSLKTLKWFIDQDIGLGPLSKEEAAVDEHRSEDPLREQSIGMVAIHYASEASERFTADILASILEKRPQDINLPNRYGETPLSLALGPGRYNTEQVAFLLANGADPKACPTEEQRAVLTAVQEGEPETEIEEIVTRVRTSRQGAANRDQAQVEAERGQFVRDAERLGIGLRQAQILYEKRVELEVTSDLRNFGWSVDDIVKCALHGRLTEEEGTLCEVRDRVLEEEKRGLRQRNRWSFRLSPTWFYHV